MVPTRPSSQKKLSKLEIIVFFKGFYIKAVSTGVGAVLFDGSWWDELLAFLGSRDKPEEKQHAGLNGLFMLVKWIALSFANK